MSSRVHFLDAAAALGLVALGALLAFQTSTLPEAPSYAHVGPRLFPGLVAMGLVVCGLLLFREALTGGFRNALDLKRARADWRAFAWVSAGVIAHMALIGWVGFIAASTILFACVARAFGSTRPARDVAIGAALATVTFIIFTQGLGLALPSGLPSVSA